MFRSSVTMKLLGLVLFISGALCWEMTLLHVNDIHARMEETSKYSGPCQEKDKLDGKCFGGLARISKAVENIKKDNENVVWLNAGDFFQGTIWYSKFKWEPIVEFNNLLNFDAMTLGNHEFDGGLEGILPFVTRTTCPIVVSNFDATNMEAEFRNSFTPSTILNFGEKKVGVIGYVTPETAFTSNPPSELKFLDELEQVTEEVRKLTNQGVNIIIALGHSGYKKDKEIAQTVPGIDIVVGAHSHSFLFTETDEDKNPSNNEIRGPYPTVVTNIEGKKVLVVQAFAFTKYLGHIKLNFTDDGLITNWQGMPILLDNNFEKDEIITNALAPWKNQLDQITRKIVAETRVVLSKSREVETNLGNLLTDAMVFAYKNKTNADGFKFKRAILNSGGIRTSINIGNITIGDVLTVLPFEHTFDTLSVSGKDLKEAFEHSVSGFGADGTNDEGRFLQVSGFKLTFDVSKQIGSRVRRVQTICVECDEDIYEDLDNEKMYPVITTNYVANGGDGFTSISENKNHYEIGELDTDSLQEYLIFHSPVQPEIEERISFNSAQAFSSRSSSAWPEFFLFNFLSFFL